MRVGVGGARLAHDLYSSTGTEIIVEKWLPKVF